MKDLFLSEVRRFRVIALIVGFSHLLLLQFLSRTGSLLQQSYFEGMPLFVLYLLLGVVLAVWQVGSYRKPSQWLWLMHRPLPPTRIFLALALSALALLTVAILLPQLLLLLALDTFTSQVVDLRHYLCPPYLLSMAWMLWMAAAHAVLSRSKVSAAIVAVPPLLAMHLVSMWVLWLPLLACLAWIGFVAARSFRADRETPPQGAPSLLLTALPLQLGLFLLLFKLGQFAFVTGSILLGTDPLNTEYPPEGGLIEAQRMPPAQLIAAGLIGSDDARAESWREQLPLLEPSTLAALLQRFPIRHQLSNLQMPTQWSDQQRDIFWTFSHDQMLFVGRDPRSGAARGVFGMGGIGDETPFPEVPIAHEDRYLATRSVLYAIDPQQQRLHPLLQLQPDEWFNGLPQAEHNRLLVLSNRSLSVWRRDRDAADEFAPLHLDWQLPLPQGPDRFESVQVARLMDGWLLTFLYGDGLRQIGFSQYLSPGTPQQSVWFVDESGNASLVGERTLLRDYPLHYQSHWWLSPALHVLADWPESALDKSFNWPFRPMLWPSQSGLQFTALALLLASLLLALGWLRGSRIPPARRRLWLASCALIGLPALLSMVCLESRAPRD